MGMNRNLSLVAVAATAAALFVTGCANTHIDGTSSTQTSVNLSQNNYRVLVPGAIGTSHGFKLLGILPMAGATGSKARANLYRDLGISLRGKSIALANTTVDKSTTYLILFSLPKIIVQADVIEYVDPRSSSPPPSAQGPTIPAPAAPAPVVPESQSSGTK